jgi:hypothetical protein
MMNNIIKAIKKLNPTAEVVVRGNDFETCEIEWHNGTPPISAEQILAIIPQVELDMAMETLRAKRNKLLADTDYLALSDNTMTEEVRTYRQALRDITEGLTTKEQVEAVVFPNKPQGII